MGCVVDLETRMRTLHIISVGDTPRGPSPIVSCFRRVGLERGGSVAMEDFRLGKVGEGSEEEPVLLLAKLYRDIKYGQAQRV